MVTCGFFNSVYGDRKYDADQMSDFYTGIVTQGVFQHVDNGLEVTAGTGLTVSVNTGRAIIQNKWVKNDTPLILELAPAPTTYGRFDRVVLKYDSNSRNVQIIVKTGTPAGTPGVPELVREGGIYEMCLADIDVEAGATSVTVTDTRSDTTLCGWASVAQATSGEVDQMLNDLKTGFDGSVYATPAAEVQGSDQKLQDQINNIGLYNIIPSAFGYTASARMLAKVSNPNLMYFNLKNKIKTTDTVKVKITFKLIAVNVWCYLNVRLVKSSPYAYQETGVATLDGNTAKNTVLIREKDITPNNTFDRMLIYFNNTSVRVDFDLLKIELYVNGNLCDLIPDTSTLPEHTTLTINPKGSLATLDYVDNNFAKKISDLDAGKWLLPNYYTVCPDLDNNNMYGIKLYVDYMTFDEKTVLANHKDHVSIFPPRSQTSNVETSTKALKYIQDVTERPASQNISIISTKESVTDKKLRILTIGDSVTEGYGSDGLQYWKTLYRHLRINSILKESGYVPLMLGTRTLNYTFEYDGSSYTDLIGAEGYSGASLKDFYQSPSNKFYNESATGDCKFSINAWLSKYRTMDDNGNRLELNDPNIGSLVTAETLETMNVCTPNVVIINLGHNDFYQSWTENMNVYYTMYNDIMAVIRAELPNAYVIPCVTMPLIGTMHPDLHTDRDCDNALLSSVPWYISRYKANVEHWKTFIAENTDTHIVVMPEWNITPTIEAFKWYNTANESGDYYYTKDEFTRAHPYKPAHDVYGYELYAMCQYIKTLMP